MIYYIEDDLFNAPSDQLLVHAVNCQGVWGSGIAKKFATYFIDESVCYKAYCEHLKRLNLSPVGDSLIINDVGCLFTSFDYGENVDKPEEIVKNTRKAIADLISKTTMKIAMPKINSGLFKVPWEQTEAILKEFPHVEFYVYTGAK